MNPVVIFGDSTLDLGKDLYKKFNIQIPSIEMNNNSNNEIPIKIGVSFGIHPSTIL